MNDDFNTPILIAHLFEVVKWINSVHAGKAQLTAADIEHLQKTLKIFVFDILGLVQEEGATASADNDNLDAVMQILLQLRQQAKQDKNWAQADFIRDQLQMAYHNNKNSQRGIAILGSTGNIGEQALDLLNTHAAHFTLKLLTANTQSKRLAEQALQWKAEKVYLHDKAQHKYLKRLLQGSGVEVLDTETQMYDCFQQDDLHLVLVAVVGYAGMLPTLRAIQANKDVALANKESLVVAGAIITQAMQSYSGKLIPVDSEHSAIFQCLQGEAAQGVEKLILTASGGPFFKLGTDEWQHITLAQALKHPTWNMGHKITIDSASMMNKGLEVIEAHWLFGIAPKDIEVVIHPQSLIHSMVQFIDGSVKAQLNPPDMRGPIHYAMFYPEREAVDLKRLNFSDYAEITFTQPDTKKFKTLALAYQALEQGGNMPAVLNAANEAVVAAVLREQLPFYRIARVLEEMMQRTELIAQPSLEELQETHNQIITKTNTYINQKIWI